MGSQIDSSTLLKAAWAASEKAYAPYSKFLVGAALLCESGDTFTGCNVENVSFGLTICAERAAVFAAICAGKHKFGALAIVAKSALPIVPCGACRQVLAEFNPSLLIFSEAADGRIEERCLAELFPLPSEGILEDWR